MAEKFVIDIFAPADFIRQSLNLPELNKIFGRNLTYASMGRFALYHILSSLKIHDKILLPAYLCPSVLLPLRLLKIQPVFYDIDKNDLNASRESIEFLSKKFKVKTVLVASLYGNPADLAGIEKFCQISGIKLIDDAAQSFGAKLDGRLVGSFGNAGFFSFSPGKATAGHLGAFFWTENPEYVFARTRHCLFHRLVYLDFYFNRLRRGQYRPYQVFGALTGLRKIYSRLIDIRNDDICQFEENILGGIVGGVFSGSFQFRKKYFSAFVERFRDNRYFRIIQPRRGEPVNHKIVLCFSEMEIARKFINYMRANKIYCSAGYSLLTTDWQYLPNCQDISEKIAELPIEDDEKKMEYLFERVESFLK